MSRYDTLNKFPEIMELMGHSAEDAAAATARLRDGVLGLPTSLDEIVANAQRLTILTGNLELATDTTLALNNAFLASGATATDASRGLTQYVQQLSKGTVDMVSWRTLQETMGYALREVSVEMLGVGKSSNDLYEALKSGDVTFDELNNKIIELSTEVGGFADMAKEASGGIGASWTNMQTAITRGVANIIKSIDENLTKNSLPNLQESIGLVGVGFEKFLNIVANVSGKIISVAAPAVKAISNNLDTLIPLLGSAVAGFAAFSIVKTVQTTLSSASKAIQAYNTATALMSAITAENTAVQTLNSLATDKSAASEAVRMAMRKAGMAVDAQGTLVTAAGTVATEAEAAAIIASSSALTAKQVIVGLLTGKITIATAAQWAWNAAMTANPIGIIIAALAAAVTAVALFTKHTDDSYKSLDNLNDSVKNANKSLGEINKGYDNSAQKAGSSAIAAGKLVDELERMESQFYNAEKQQWESTVQQQRYATVVQELNGLMPDLNLQIDEQSGLLSENKEAVRASIETWKEYYIQQAFIERNTELLKNYGDVVVSLSDAQADLNIVQSEEAGLLEHLRVLTGLNTGQIKDQAYWLAQGAQQYGDNATAVSDLAQRLYLLTLDEAEFTTAIENGQATLQMYDSQIEDNTKKLDAFSASTEKAAGETDSLTESEEDLAAAAEAAKEKLAAQNKVIERLADEYITLKDKATDMFNTLSDESKITVSEMTTNLEENQRVISEWATNIEKLAKQGIDQGLLETLRAAGPESAGAVKTLVNSIETDPEGLQKLSDTFAGGGNVAKEALATSLGLAPDVVDAAIGLANTTTDSLINELEIADIPSIGDNVADAFARGIVRTSWKAERAVREMAQAAIRAGNAVNEIASPSKVYRRMGEFSVEGFVQGIEKRTPDAVNAVIEMGQEALGGINVGEWIKETNSQAINNLPLLVSTISGSFDEIAAAISETLGVSAEDAEAWLDAVSSSIEQSAKELEEYGKRIAATQEKITQTTTDMFSKMDARSEVTIFDMIENLQHNQKVVEDWGNNIAKLAEQGVDEGLLDTLRDAGPESAKYVAEMVKWTGPKLKQLSDLYAQGGKAATDALAKAFGMSTDAQLAAGQLATTTADTLDQRLDKADFPGMGGNITIGLANGILSKLPVAVSAITKVASSIKNAAAGVLQIASPSKAFAYFGTMIGEGLVVGMERIAGKVQDAAKAIMKIPSDRDTWEYINEMEAYWSEWLVIRKAQIDRELELEKERINTIIAGLNTEMAARREVRATESAVESAEGRLSSANEAAARAEKELARARVEVTYARDENARIEAEKLVMQKEAALLAAQDTVRKAQRDYEDQLWYAQKQAEINAEKAKIAEAESAAERAKIEAEAAAKKGLQVSIEGAYQYEREMKAAAEQSMKDLANSVLTAIVAGGVAAVQTVIPSVSKSASVTVNTGGGVTSGQIYNTVTKILEGM